MPQPSGPPRSSYGALVDECLFMGWPRNPDDGRSVVEEFLGTVGYHKDESPAFTDLYGAVNRIRSVSWQSGSVLWSRYVDLRRREAEKFSHPHRVSVRLHRTVTAEPGADRVRVRLPLPLTHAAQPETGWHIESVRGDLLSQRELPGALDLQILAAGSTAAASVIYQAALNPQGPSGPWEAQEGDPAPVESPFVVAPILKTGLFSVKTGLPPRETLHALWRQLCKFVRVGHVYHHEFNQAFSNAKSEDRPWVDCVAAAWVLASLAQTAGIPARIVSGILLNGFGPAYHYWAEFLIDGTWLPVDSYGWDLGRDDEEWRDRFFGSLDCRVRFECLPGTFSRFLPGVPWFMERSVCGGGALYRYRHAGTGRELARDEWSLISAEP